MWTALITGLAALTGAAIGGLVTVWATHKTNVAAAERERAQRLHDLQAAQYAEAKETLAKFLAYWHRAASAKDVRETDLDATFGVTDYASQLQLLLPDLADRVSAMVRVLHSESRGTDDSLLRGDFVYAAQQEINRLEPKA